ncbi:nuclease-related domain-containing protein [Bacillus sp. UNC438CL73TsuS30]|uniref:nuclease-related domain-containing protein n=1 Tax=Bacillus sp. UNC438CL73TsuS30 TaxID=1340434 RepID=UPI00068F039A|nr:nuclease-related domain-containing protein [Bacillus sp. UNC438CL73TsuS30]
MNLKPLTLPPMVEKIDALLRRIRFDHPKMMNIQMEREIKMKGYQGQKVLEFYLDQLPEKKYDIINDLRLYDGKYFFQIDVLVLSTAFLLNVEAKNRGKEIIFERDLEQVTLVRNSRKERIDNPVIQAKTQARKLGKWLQNQNCAAPPIHYLFVNSNKQAKITFAYPNHPLNRDICNSEGLLEKIEQIEEFEIEKMTQKELRKIARLLLAHHTPEDPDILQYFDISPKEISTGVQCPHKECKFIGMERRYGTWCCPKCGTRSKDAHIQSISDYFLLIKPSITNAELCDFLHINPRLAYKILTSMNLPFTGKFRDRVYHKSASTNPSNRRNPANLPLNKAP